MKNSSKRIPGPFAVLLVVLAALAVVAAGCGSNNSGSSSSTPAASAPSTSAKATIAVPDAIRSKGTLTVATDPTYAPNEFVDTDGRTIIGMDVDLAKAIGQKLGVGVQVQKSTFDAIIPGLAARRYDLGVSSFTDTKERERTVDFVTYYRAGTSFYVRSGGPDVSDLASVCGKKVAVEKGTTQATDVQAQNRRCGSGGAATLQVYPDQNGANLAVQSGRADVGMADSPVVAYIVKQSNGTFRIDGQPYGTAPYGIAIPKDSGLQQPVLQAIRALMRDGTYSAILRRWGIELGAIDNPQINGATS